MANVKRVGGVGCLLAATLLAVAPARAGSNPPALGQLLQDLAVQPAKERVPAPPFALPDLAGTDVELAHLRGRVVMLYFWTTY